MTPKFRGIAFIKFKTTMTSLLGVVRGNLLTFVLAIHAECFGYVSEPLSGSWKLLDVLPSGHV